MGSLDRQIPRPNNMSIVMRRLPALALALAAAALGLAGGRWLWPAMEAGHGAEDAPSSPQPPGELPAEAGSPPAETCVESPRPTLPVAPRRGPEPLAPFAEGTAILRIGDGYVFGEDHARPAADEAHVDLLCEDIRGGATLACPAGALAADLPLAAVGLPDTPTGAAALLVDAPPDLPQRHATLAPRPQPERAGVALVRARAGKTFKVWLEEERGDPNALKRLVRLGYAEVPVVEGGGVLRLPTTQPAGKDAAPTVAEVERLAKAGASIPGGDFTNFLGGPWERFTPPDGEIKSTKGTRLLIDPPLRSTLIIDGSYGGAYAVGGVAEGGVLENRTYAGFAVRGDMAGKVRIRSYAYLHVTGDLTGEVDVGSYATIVIDGDLRGTLKVRSYVTLLLRGRLFGKIDPSGSCWSTFWFQGWRSRAEIEGMEGRFSQVTLHLEQTDAPPGKLDPTPGTWREVIVADPGWKKIQH